MRKAGSIGKRARGAARSAAWLAFLAAGVQALLPLIIAFDLVYIMPSLAPAATVPCHEVDESAAGDPSGVAAQHASAHREDGGTGQAPHQRHALHCPLCTALHASQAHLSPTDIPLKAPAIERRALLAADGASLALRPVAAAYSPRAPPLAA
jgi:hypothetical protein